MGQLATGEEIVVGSWGSLTLTRKSSGVATLTMNAAGGVNALSSETLQHFRLAIDCVERDDEIKALIITSGKPDLFIAGADIKEILKFETKEVAHELSSGGGEVFKRIEKLEKPVLSAIHGVCLGGGLELALASSTRIATDDPATRLGLPEVTLGLIPGLGGTQRLPRLIGLKPALDMILSGEPVGAKRALELGLVDQLVKKEELERRCEEILESRIQDASTGSPYNPQRHLDELEEKALELDGGIKKRDSMLKMSERAVRIRTKGFYPAPAKAIEAIKRGPAGGSTLEEGLAAESELFSELAVSPEAKNLISFYFNKEMSVLSAKRALSRSGPVRTLGIIGAGRMGCGIAEQALSVGINVVLLDATSEASRSAAQRLTKRLDTMGLETDYPEVRAADSFKDLSTCDFVIEAVFEDESLKNDVIASAFAALPDESILASNTSSLAIGKLADRSDSAERLLGLHFFSPVDRMPLVEVVGHGTTPLPALQKATAFVGQIGKVPLLVSDSPGFLVNRLLAGLLMEAARTVRDGVPIDWVEKAATDFGLPMGALALFDELGWDLASKVASLLNDNFGERFTTPPLMHDCLKLDIRGRCTSAGFYKYDESGRRLGFNHEALDKLEVPYSDEPLSEEHRERILNRLLLPMVDEAARCLDEKIVRKARDVDLAMIMGAAFPPFRGGLLRYADDLGMDYVVENLEPIYRDCQPTREVSEFLKNMRAVGRRFYGLA